jgi:hypothetical protein
MPPGNGTHVVFLRTTERGTIDRGTREANMSETVTRKRQSGLLAPLSAAWKAIRTPPPEQLEQGRWPAERPAGHRHRDAVAVLTAARCVVQRGWVQNTWYVMQTPAGRRRSLPSAFPGRVDRTNVVEACLVGAVIHAAWQQSPRPERAYPALDALWHTLLCGDIADVDPVGPLCSPPIRLARVRDLTSWNDRRYRSKDEVLDLLERTVIRIADADRHTEPHR